MSACAALVLSGCVFERAQTAEAAKSPMIGLSKGDVLACMGVPQAKVAEGNVEVWNYDSGNGRTDTFSNAFEGAVRISC